ncbi:glycosyltransferase [Loigolactobacillus coryniformis]|uniref:Glycosyltransferase n=1 Tax=Loigolactobacillus coryniformis TaxID=1610 RepID=A0A5B8TLR8_9LACO|nr:glycosyltransferase [Loigolactobacillus coryniformis]QEA54176.1 glycosyltransferase [Loigolactobacillus coryniformis]
MSMKTCAVVVTYNRLELLKECLAALLNQSASVAHVVVVNNNSDDGTTEYLNQLNDDRLIIHNSTKNLGGAGGFSFGLDKAVSSTDDDYFWLMDDDTIVDQYCNQALLDKAKKLNDQFGFLAANVRWTDGTPSNVPIPTADWPMRITEGLVEISVSTFVAFFVSRANVVKVGLPLAEFFIWQDDVEYCLRVGKLGPSYLVDQAIAVHKSASKPGTFLVQNDVLARVPRYYYQFRNNMYITRHYHGGKAVRKMVRVNLIDTIRVFIKAKNHRFKRASTEFRGTIKGLTFEPKVKFVNKN